jgi:uncharacterized paraquat-inducible protein A
MVLGKLATTLATANCEPAAKIGVFPVFLWQTAQTEVTSCKHNRQLQAVIHFIGNWNFNGLFRTCIITVKLINVCLV